MAAVKKSGKLGDPMDSLLRRTFAYTNRVNTTNVNRDPLPQALCARLQCTGRGAGDGRLPIGDG